MKDRWIALIGQAIAALAVISSNQTAIAPLKAEQEILGIKITSLAEKVGLIEKRIGGD